MKNIWIINHYAEPPGPGKFTRHFHFAKKLTERGYSVKIFTASTVHTTDINYITNESPYKEMTIDGINYVFVKTTSYHGNGNKRIINMIDFFRRIPFVTRHFGDCDLVYASSPHSLTWLCAQYVAKKKGAKFVAETRDLWPETFIAMGKLKKGSLPARILYGIEKKIYKEADALIFTFPGGQEYVDALGIQNKKIYYINNGIDLKEFREREQFNYHDDDLENRQYFNVAFTGALGKANGLERVLKSFEKLQKDGHDDIRFILYGSGTEEEKLKRMCEDSGLKNVLFKGRVEKQYIPSILKKSDLLLLSLAHLPQLFKYGLSPNKLFEYLAAGKPIISNVECGYDILEQTGSGMTVQGDSIESLTKGILYFKNLPSSEYMAYCEKAKAAAEKFDFEYLTDCLEKAFLDVLQSQ